MSAPPYILLFGLDVRLVETRQWVLEQAGYRVCPVTDLMNLDRMAFQYPIDLFILCDSLSSDMRTRTLALLHARWPLARILVLTPISLSGELEPNETLFLAMDGPHKLVALIHQLLANDPALPA